MIIYNNIYQSKNFTFFKSQEETYYKNLYRQRFNNSDENPSPQFFYLDAIHGAGKTNSIVEKVTSSCLEHGGVYFYVPPTRILGEQTHQEFINQDKLNPDNIFMCFKDTDSNVLFDGTIDKPKSATEKVINALTLSKTKDYTVIIISHKTLLENIDVRDRIKQSNGHALIDELPPLMVDKTLTVYKHTRDFIGSIFEVSDSYNDLYTLKMRETEFHMDDSLIDSHIKDAIRTLKRNGIVLVKKVQWNRLIGIPSTISIEETIVKDNHRVKLKEKNQLTIVSIESPKVFEGFYSTTFFSADFNHNPIMKSWSRYYGVDFKLAEDFKQYLRYYSANETTIGSRIDVAYGMRDSFSKSCRTKMVNEKTIYKHQKESAKDFTSGSKKTLVVRNKDAGEFGDGSVETYSNGAVEVSLYSHGANQYSNADSIIVIASANLNPTTISILKSFDWTDDDLNYFYNSAVIQAVMRTSLRDPKSTKRVKIFLADYRAVQHLKKFFGNDIHIDHSYALESTKIPGLSRSNQYSRKKMDEIQEFFLQCSYKERSVQKNFQGVLDSQEQSKLNFSMIKNIEDKNPTHHVIEVVDLIKSLKGMTKHNKVHDKKDAGLFSNIIFNGDGRQKKDALAASFGVFDFDNSSLSMKEMTEIFANEFGDSIFSIGTFSSNRQDPHHYRILTIFDHNIPINNLYEFYGHVEYTLKTNYNLLTVSGKDRDSDKLYTGIDRSKYNESSFFFLPSFKEEDGQLEWIQPAKTYEKLQNSRLDVMSIIESSKFVKELREERKKQEDAALKLEQQRIQKSLDRKKQEETRLDNINKLRSIVKTKPLNINNPKDKAIFDQFNGKNNLFDKLMTQVEELVPGNRSSLACSIAGKGQFLDDHNLKRELYDAIVLRGIDKSTQKSVKNYLRI